MIQKIKAPISVITAFNHKNILSVPVIINWDGKTYKVKKVGFHHKYKIGNTLYHSYSVTCSSKNHKSTFFKIILNTASLSWELEEISDGEAD